MASSVLSPVKRQVDYPSSDGEPVAESDVHISCLLHTREGSEALLRRPARRLRGRQPVDLLRREQRQGQGGARRGSW